MKEVSGCSVRKACKLVSLNRSTYDYCVRENPEDLLIRKRMRELALQRPRIGSPRLTVLLRREFGSINHKRVERIYKEEKLQVPVRRKRNRRSVLSSVN